MSYLPLMHQDIWQHMAVVTTAAAAAAASTTIHGRMERQIKRSRTIGYRKTRERRRRFGPSDLEGVDAET